MARPDCPRCGSALIVAAPSGAPSEVVMELRGEPVPAAATETERMTWLCRSCGLRWDPGAYADRSLVEPDAPELPRATTRREAPLASTTGGVPAPDPRHGPGETLRRAREHAGKSVADIARATGVWERHVMALEEDAPLEEFPAHSYARLYLREYATSLGLDPEPLLQQLDASHPTVEENVLEPLPDTRGRKKVLAVVLAALSVVALVFIAVNRPSMPAGVRSHVPSSQPTTPVQEPATQEPPPPPKEPNGVRVELAVSERSWVQAVSDGEVVAAQTFEPGKQVAYRARKTLELTLGNAGGVRLRVDGERVRTGTPGEVVTLRFHLRDGTVSMARA